MKQYSPIVFFVIILFWSCTENIDTYKTQNLVIDSINSNISKSQIGDTENIRLESSNKAFFIAVKSKEDSLIYKALYNKIQTDIIYQHNDSVIYYLEKLKTIYKAIPNEASYYFLKGLYYHNISADSRFASYEKSQKLFVSVGQYERAGYSLMMMSEIQRLAADYVGAESSMIQALKYYKDSESNYNHIYNVFGLIYRGLYDYENALQSYNNALKYTDKNNNKERNIIQNNIALIYQEKKDYEKAIAMFDSLNNLPSLNDDILMKAKVLSNLGYSIFLSKKGDGLSYLKQAEIIQDTIDDSFGRLANYLISAEAYGKKDRATSKAYATKAYDLAKQLNNGEEKLKALELLIKATDSKPESDKRFSEYVTLNDSINTARQIAKNGFAKIKYDSSEAEKNALKSKLIAERAQANNILLVVIAIFLAILAFVIYFFMKRKSAIDQVKASYATELRISKKVHDELANDIYNIMAYSGTHDFSSEEKKEKLLNSLDNIYIRTRDISKENATIETGENYPQQLMGMLSEYQNEKVNVLHSGIKEMNWEKIDDIKKIAVYRILQELMVNMTKHSKAELCMVRFTTKGKNSVIFYSDNGVGIGSDKIIFKNGLANAENRIKGIGGSLTFESNPQMGLKMTIVFPA